MTIILEWVLGYGGGKVADGLLRSLRGDPFAKDLLSALEAWRTTLPEDGRLDSAAALFPRGLQIPDLPSSPNLLALRSDIAGARIPSQAHWHAALLEQWRHVRVEIDDCQDFFRIAEDRASQLLDDLAARLVDVCARYPHLFNPTILATIARMQVSLEKLSERPVETPRDYPITTLAIAWTAKMYEIDPLYQAAMRSGRSWPGEQESLVLEEDRLFQALRARLSSAPEPARQLVADLEAFRSGRGGIDAEWHTERASLLERLARFERLQMNGYTGH